MNADSDLSDPKPTLLNLFDTYYSPLQDGLRPIMKSFILALLPGLEEETGEFFDKVFAILIDFVLAYLCINQVLALLDRLSGTVSPSFFLQNIWLIMLTSPSARGTSINFLSRRLPRLNPNEGITPRHSYIKYLFAHMKSIRYCSHRWT